VASLGDLLRFTDRQTFLGQTVLNVYFYRITSITGLDATYLDVLGAWFVDNVITPVASLQSDDVSHVELFMESITNGVDINSYTTDLPIAGAASGDNLPPYTSYGFQLIRESRVTRNGYKRFAGVTEPNQTNGVYTGGSTPITDIENALKSDIVIGLVTVAEPVIVKHPITVPMASYEYASIGDCLFKGIGTQNTRKFGRGV